MVKAQSAIRMALALVVFALLAFTVALIGAFLQATTIADETSTDIERSLLRNHFDVATRATLSSQTVQLTWDDAMRKAGGQGQPVDTRWTDTFIGQFLYNNLRAQHIFLVAPDGSLIRAWDNGKPGTGQGYAKIQKNVRLGLSRMAQNHDLRSKPAGYRQLADARWPLNAQGQPLSRQTYGLGSFGGRAAIMTLVSITPDNQIGLLKQMPNSVLAVRTVDQALLDGFSSELMLKDLRYSNKPMAGGGLNVLELKGRSGTRLGWISWKPNDVGAVIMRRTMPMVISYFTFYLVVLACGIVVVRHAIRLAREYAAREARAQRNALHDPMLGLPNRTLVMQRLAKQLNELGLTGEGDVMYLAYVDLDHFKAINDSIGHHIGDELLADVVKRLRGTLEKGDMLGRLASDEFVVLRRGDGGRSGGDDLGKAIMAAFAEPFQVLGHTLAVTASCGIAWAPDHSRDATELLRLADIALFRAKQRGRARFRCFTEDMNSTIRWRQDMEVELRRAIACDDLEVLYQPIVNITDRRIVCFESLLRWTHRHRGKISPGVFVPLAEHSGLMPLLGEWVLRRVFADSRQFADAEISVNLSPLQITARDFLSQLRGLIGEFDIDPCRFIFEVTEGVLLDNSDQVLTILGEIRDMGFRIALDDFGTGYSSLGYLRSFQFDRIKIDRSFVQGIETDLDAQAILKAVVSLGRTLRMKVIAEGVETLLQQRLVEAAGCELIQGHLYWRALPVDRACELIEQDTVADEMPLARSAAV